MQKLNAKEAAVLEYLSREIGTRGYAPSVRDVCEALGYASTSTVQAYLDRLERYGYIRREGGKSRSIVLSDRRRPKRIPVLRQGSDPMTATEADFDGYLDFCYCGDLGDGETLFACFDSEKKEYRIFLGSREIARIAIG